jgi:hypothetical protein
MKKIITLLALMLININSNAQEFIAPGRTIAKHDSTTTYTYKCPEQTYKVYKSNKGAFYIWKVSKKTNKRYKYYLPKDIQIAMGRKYEDK